MGDQKLDDLLFLFKLDLPFIVATILFTAVISNLHYLWHIQVFKHGYFLLYMNINFINVTFPSAC